MLGLSSFYKFVGPWYFFYELPVHVHFFPFGLFDLLTTDFNLYVNIYKYVLGILECLFCVLSIFFLDCFCFLNFVSALFCLAELSNFYVNLSIIYFIASRFHIMLRNDSSILSYNKYLSLFLLVSLWIYFLALYVNFFILLEFIL